MVKTTRLKGEVRLGKTLKNFIKNFFKNVIVLTKRKIGEKTRSTDFHMLGGHIIHKYGILP